MSVSDRSFQRRVDDLVLQLKGLVHVRALLESYGASSDELDAHTEEIARVRRELANLVAGSRESLAFAKAS